LVKRAGRFAVGYPIVAHCKIVVPFAEFDNGDFLFWHGEFPA
jgi:hypothetical protein